MTKRKRAARPDPAPMPRHCDEYIDDPTVPQALRTFLARARMPGHGLLEETPFPKLFATRDGIRVRITMASRLGDVGYTTNLSVAVGYDGRDFLQAFSHFAETP